ncbi:Cell wall synthesis protein KNH1 [Cyberlindnera fabianii]|uniref:Cell wall synthesis protein KNH1 n=1 Tax=Cyberlindnera fabianii TaxID=36022 RepID=A0A1V2L2F5_CYBFA|nr:Cell wall synthesis protein KNH1 [Cyberlindnera fabianii]
MSHTKDSFRVSQLSKTWAMLFSLLLFACLFTPSHADVSVSKPLTGESYSASNGKVSIPITWIESNADPKLSDITEYTFKLCTGPNADIHGFDDEIITVKASDIDGYSYDFSVNADVGADGQYYVQIYAASKSGWTIHYTNRFELTDMSGSYKPSVGAVTTPPSGQTSLADGTNTGVATINSASFSTYYTSQTGKTRFAPMQTQPGSKVTAARSQWTRQYPTSAVTYYTSLSTHLEQLSTRTAGWSYTISSAVNWASPAPFPSENGGWYAASARLTKTPTLYTPDVLAGASTATSG